MQKRVVFNFFSRKKKQTISGEAPEFVLQEFMSAPNAKEFIRKAYISSIRKIVTDIDEGRSGTVTSDLESMEAVIARSLKFTREDITDWINSRDWTQVKNVANIGLVTANMKKLLPELATRRNPFSAQDSERVVLIVMAAVMDKDDPVGEYILTTLSTERGGLDVGQLGFS